MRNFARALALRKSWVRHWPANGHVPAQPSSSQPLPCSSPAQSRCSRRLALLHPRSGAGIGAGIGAEAGQEKGLGPGQKPGAKVGAGTGVGLGAEAGIWAGALAGEGDGTRTGTEAGGGIGSGADEGGGTGASAESETSCILYLVFGKITNRRQPHYR